MDMAEQMCDRVVMIYRGNKVLDGTLDEIKAGYGDNVVRAGTGGGQALPDRIDGVKSIVAQGRHYDLQLDNERLPPTRPITASCRRRHRAFRNPATIVARHFRSHRTNG